MVIVVIVVIVVYHGNIFFHVAHIFMCSEKTIAIIRRTDLFKKKKSRPTCLRRRIEVKNCHRN